MSTPIITIEEDKSVEGTMAILNKYKINRLPIVHDSSIQYPDNRDNYEQCFN